MYRCEAAALSGVVVSAVTLGGVVAGRLDKPPYRNSAPFHSRGDEVQQEQM